MGFILQPLKQLGLTRIKLTSGDGAIHDCHPLLAAYVGDYPKQGLVTCTKTGKCPSGTVGRDELGDPDIICVPRDLEAI
jgi:Plavaka transposase